MFHRLLRETAGPVRQTLRPKTTACGLYQHPAREAQGEWFGHSQFQSLSNFAPEALSDRGTKRLKELQRKFGDQQVSDDGITPQTTWRAVPPRIPDDAVALMSDADWIHAMQTLELRSSGRFSDRDWDQASLSSQLRTRTTADPERFAALAARDMPEELPPSYFSAVLEGLAEVERDAVPLQMTLQVIRQLHALPGRPCGLAIGRAIRSIATAQVPSDILEVVAFYATLDPDPVGEDWVEMEPDGDHRLARAITAGINSVRGVAAEAIAGLLFADAGRIEQLGEAVESLVGDRVLAVRALAVRSLLAILRDDEPRSIALFGTLCAGAEPILGSQYVEEYLHWAMYRSYESVRPTLLGMLNSPDSSARRAAARQICLAALQDGESKDLAIADAKLVVEGPDRDAR